MKTMESSNVRARSVTFQNTLDRFQIGDWKRDRDTSFKTTNANRFCCWKFFSIENVFRCCSLSLSLSLSLSRSLERERERERKRRKKSVSERGERDRERERMLRDFVFAKCVRRGALSCGIVARALSGRYFRGGHARSARARRAGSRPLESPCGTVWVRQTVLSRVGHRWSYTEISRLFRVSLSRVLREARDSEP